MKLLLSSTNHASHRRLVSTLPLALVGALSAACASSADPQNTEFDPSSNESASETQAARHDAAPTAVVLPAGLDSLDAHSAEVQARLDEAVQRTRSSPHSDDVVVFVDEAGNPLLPNRDAPVAASLLSNELTFTYSSAGMPFTPAELSSVQGWVATCYPLIKQIYGAPAFANTVNVRKDTTGAGAAGYYYPWNNEIVLGVHNVEATVLCHEIIHAFHDDYIVSMSSWEEGMTRAAEIEVTRQAGIPNTVDHSYMYNVFYQSLNQPLVAATGGQLWAGWSQTLMRYQLSGYAWAKPLLENADFFVDFNEAYYGQAALDPSLPSNETALVALVASVRTQVENRPFSAWYADQHVLDTNPTAGNQFFVRGSGFDSLSISTWRRNGDGTETNLTNVPVSWTAKNDVGATLASGSNVTNSVGVVSVSSLDIPLNGYVGRIQIAATATLDGVPFSSSTEQTTFNGEGVFGVVIGANSGSITFTTLDVVTTPVTVSVTHGAFDAPSLLSARGRLQYVLTTASGTQAPVVFTKDDKPYFVRAVVSTACTPSCSGKQCGSDGCGGSCGTCSGSQTCNASQQCVSTCTPSCSGKQCGSDGCGGSCGTCSGSQTCNSAQQCVATCTPSCSGKQCGSDGCGGSCGTCSGSQTCNSAQQCVGGGSCGGLSTWSAGSYSAGARVQASGTVYECKPWPYSGWCGAGAAYQPGVGFAWQDAWSVVGPCP